MHGTGKVNVYSKNKSAERKKVLPQKKEKSCKIKFATLELKPYWHNNFTEAPEHMGTSNLTGKRIKSVKESAISDHLLQCDSPITFDDFDISVSDSNKFK